MTKSTEDNQKTWIKRFLLFSPAIFAIPIAIFAPPDILEFAEIASFVKFMELVVPAISKIDTSNHIWQVAKLFYSVAWTFAPLSAFYVFSRGMKNKNELLKVRRERGQSPGLRVLIVAFVALLSYYFWSYGLTDSSRAIEHFATYTRFGMVTVGILYMMFTVSILGMLLVQIMIFNEE